MKIRGLPIKFVFNGCCCWSVHIPGLGLTTDKFPDYKMAMAEAEELIVAEESKREWRLTEFGYNYEYAEYFDDVERDVFAQLRTVMEKSA